MKKLNTLIVLLLVFIPSFLSAQFGCVPQNENNNLQGCGSLVFNGVTYTASTTVNDTLKSITGCDSIYRSTQIDIVIPVAQNIVLHGCNSLLFNGIVFTNSSFAKDTLLSYSGCDSIYINATINIDHLIAISNVTNMAGCGSVIYNGNTYTSSTVLADTVFSTTGCDSIYNIVNIRVVKPISQTTIIRGCGSLVYNGITYTNNATLRDTVKSVLGCDSLRNVTRILIQKNVPIFQNTTFSACRSVVYNGVTYTASTMVMDTIKTFIFGCDSVYRITTITIQDIAPQIQTIFLFGCDSVVYNNKKYTASINTKDTIKSSFGCDSILINLNIKISLPATKDSVTLRDCKSITYNGVTYTDSTIVRDTILTALGCDSIYKIANIIIRNVQTSQRVDTLLGCNTITFNGVAYTDSTTVLDTLRTPEGCDSIFRTTHITIIKSTPLQSDTSIFSCSSIVINGTNYDSSATISDTIKTVLGCDSIVHTTYLTIRNLAPTTVVDTLSDCNKVIYNGTTYTTSTIITDTLQTPDGCDSIYNVTNILIKVITTTQSTTFTSCSSLFFNGQLYTSSAVIRDTIKTSAGCDSIYKIINLDIQNNPTRKDTTITGCNSLVFNGVTYTASAVLKDTVRSIQYCDSIYNTYNLIVKIIIPVSATNAVNGCNSLVFNGITYTASATVLDTLKTPEGCDSVFRTNIITVQNVVPVSNTTYLSGCNSLVYNGITYISSTVLTDTIRSIGTCDSIYNITDIRIVIPVAENNTVTGCNGSVVFNGITYTQSTTVLDTLKSVSGCDSIYRTNIIHVENIVATLHITNLSGCGSVLYNGVTYTSPTVLRDTLTSVGGCDSIYNQVNISIVITPVVLSASLNGCGSVVFNGITYTSSAVINDTLRTAGGCDSIYNTTNINVQNITPVNVTIIHRGCSGSVVFNGITYTASVVLHDTTKSMYGCDSIYATHNIIVENIVPTSQSLTLSDCQSIVYNGVIYTTSTFITDTVKTIGGCDSIYKAVAITINSTIVTTSTLNGCGSVVFNGVTYTSSATIIDTTKSISGCDSLYHITNITVQTITPQQETNSIAGCNTLIFNGITYTASTVLHDTLRSVAGCDSIFMTTNIIVQHIIAITSTNTLNGCGSIVYNGITYIASAVITDTVRSIGGCDSVIITTSIHIVTPITVTNTLHGCNSLVFNGITYTGSAVVKDTVKTSTGCDSLYRTTSINIQTITPTNASNQVAGCGSVVFNGITYTTSQTVKDTLKTTAGCDSIYRTTSIIVQNVTPVSVTLSLVGCGSYVYNGVTYTTSAVISDTTKSIGGCDSLFNTVSIRIVTPITVTNTLQGCNTLVFNGVSYTSSAIVKDTVKTSTGCDSLYRTTSINIQTITPTNASNQIAGCGSVVFNGITYTTSQTVKDTLKTTAGCDSIYRTTNIIVQNVTPVSVTVSVVGCGSYVYNGVTYTTSTVISDTTKSIGGCDSLYKTVSIRIVTPITVTNTLQGCNSLVFNGVTYTSSAVVKDTVKTSTGCDSLYRTTSINIQTITPTNASNQVAGCGSVVFNGITYTTSQTVKDTLKTTAGCDSIYRTTNIIVQNVTPVSVTISLVGCGSYVYNGVTYTTSAVISDTTKSIGGCDSLYNTVSIRIVTPITVTNTLQGCNSLVFNGVTYTSSAIVKDTVKTSTGCDSLYRTTSINIQTITPTNASNQVAGCGSVVFNGITYTTSQTVLDTLKTTAGCDSIYRTNNIIVQNITPVSVTNYLEGCGSIVYNGVTYTVSTVVNDTTKSIGGCDSLYNTTNINIVVPITINNNLQGCNSLVFNGVTYTASAVVNDTTKTIKGCDSLYTITHINIQKITAIPGNNYVKGCNSAVFNGVTYTTSTVVLDTLRTTVGCDSIFRTNYITIQTIVPVINAAAISGCRTVLFNGITYNSSVVVRDTIRTTGFGCDSIYNITTITVNNLNLNLSATPNPVIIGNLVTMQTSAAEAYTILSWSPTYLFPNQSTLVQSCTCVSDTTRTITVTGKSAAGCLDTASLIVTVNYLDQLFIPNTFTPNNDGRNDEFKVYGNNINRVEMRIFNQWGQMVFESKDPTRGWNGFFKGEQQPIGVYVYVVKVTLKDNSVVNKKGSLNLVR